MQKQFMWIIVFGGIFSVILLSVLVPQLKALGSAVSFVTTEVCILCAMVVAVRNKKIRLFA